MTTLAQRLGITRYRADERYRAALLAFSQRDIKAAREAVNDAIDLLPSHAEYHAAQGFFAQEDKSHDAARECYDRALQLNPYEMLANYGRGMMAYRAKEWAEAAGHFATALAAQPTRLETLYYMAMCQHRLGRNDEAMRWMIEAARLFGEANDRRFSHCEKWLREFEKLLPERA